MKTKEELKVIEKKLKELNKDVPKEIQRIIDTNEDDYEYQLNSVKVAIYTTLYFYSLISKDFIRDTLKYTKAIFSHFDFELFKKDDRGNVWYEIYIDPKIPLRNILTVYYDENYDDYEEEDRELKCYGSYNGEITDIVFLLKEYFYDDFPYHLIKDVSDEKKEEYRLFCVDNDFGMYANEGDPLEDELLYIIDCCKIFVTFQKERDHLTIQKEKY